MRCALIKSLSGAVLFQTTGNEFVEHTTVTRSVATDTTHVSYKITHYFGQTKFS